MNYEELYEIDLSQNEYFRKGQTPPFNFYAILKENGWTMEQYANEGFLRALKTTNWGMKPTKRLPASNYLKHAVNNENFIINDYLIDDTIAMVSYLTPDTDYGKEQIKILEDAGFEVDYFAGPGGCIITGPEDVNIALCYTDTHRIQDGKWLNLFKDILCELTGEEFTIDNNDILNENGEKVAGSSGWYKVGEKSSHCWSICIALSDHTEDIKRLCVKYKESPFDHKEPAYVSGIAKQQILDKFYTYLK